MTPAEARVRLWALLTRPLPEGGSLPEEVWQRRHRMMLGLLALHALGLAGLALGQGAATGQAAASGGVVAAIAGLAAAPWLSRKIRTGVVAVGLVTASAMLVHFSGGLAEAHFHMFVVLAVITLYQDWVPILVVFGYAVLHKFALGLIAPEVVFSHPAARERPLLWAFVYTGFLLAASAAGIMAWRLNERERTLASKVLDSTGEGMYGRDPAGRITFVNAAMARMVGRDPDELIGRHDHIVLGHAAEDGSPQGRAGCPACSAIAAMTGVSATGMLRPRPDGEVLPVEYAATPIRERGLTVGAVVSMRDRTEHTQLTRKALHDPLTGLANRNLLDAHLRQALARLARRPGKMVAVLFLDLDRFKVVNDSLGHTAGDEMLREVAGRLQEAIRAHDTVARFGGDEFVVLCDDFRDERDIVRVSERLIRSLSNPIPVGDQDLQVTISIGIAMTSNPNTDPDDLIRDADVAMYRAKELGRNRYELFDDTLRVRAMRRLTVERDLRGALARDELRVHYQPKVSLADGSLVGVEALVRWAHPQHGLLSPDQFIHVAEETGLIGPLGAWVLEESCRQAQAWRERYPHLRRLMLAVNLSGRQLPQPDLPEMVTDVLARTGFPPSLLCFEITESVLMADAEHTVNVLRGLKRVGVRLAVDDFGTGYSSLAYLTRFPIDILKVDRTFVMSLEETAENWSIVAAVIGLSRSLGLSTVAEGVERPEQAEALRQLGCDLAQGYHYARPQPADQLEPLLAADSVDLPLAAG